MQKSIRNLFDDEAQCMNDDSEEEFKSDEEDEDETEDEDDQEGEDISLDENQEDDLIDSIGKTKTSKNASSKVVNKSGKSQKQIGDETLPINSFSLTITKTKDDVPQALLKVIYEELILKYCIKGGIATEVGTRLGNCHLQSVIQMHCLKTKEALTALRKENSYIFKLAKMYMAFR